MQTKTLSLILLAFLTSCAGNNVVKQNVEAEVQSVQTQSHEVAAETARELIQKSTNLNNVQKEQLLLLEEQNREKYTKLTDEIEKTKIVMIQTVIQPKMDEKKFQVLKKKLLKLNQQRLDNGFASVAKARDIVAPLEKMRKIEFNDFIFHDLVRGM